VVAAQAARRAGRAGGHGGGALPGAGLVVLLLLGLYLPLLGASLLLVWLLERCLLSRIAPLARFLGLDGYSASASG